MDLAPWPLLEALVRFSAATEELTASRGRFASYEAGSARRWSRRPPSPRRGLRGGRGRRGGAVLADGRPDPPLARIAGPGEGLVLDLPKRLLDEEFGAGAIMRFEDVDFPPALVHEPTRRFLRETGLPEDGLLFQLDTEVPLPALADYYADQRPDDFSADELPRRPTA